MAFLDLSISPTIADCGVLTYRGSCFLLGIGSRFHSNPFRIRSWRLIWLGSRRFLAWIVSHNVVAQRHCEFLGSSPAKTLPL